MNGFALPGWDMPGTWINALATSGFDPVAAVLLVPLGAAALLAALPGYRLASRVNVLASLLSLLCALLLFWHRPPAGTFLMVDDLNVVFIVLNTFVGFTTATFSASVM